MTELERSRGSTSARSRCGAIVFAIFHAVLWAGVLIILVIVVPQYARTFDEFGVRLPAISLLVIRLSFAATAYWYCFVLLGTAALVVDLIFLWTLGKAGPTAQTIAGVLLAILPLLLGGLMMLSVWIPWTDLIEGLR
jgi:type II secretory pathway component PulF